MTANPDKPTRKVFVRPIPTDAPASNPVHVCELLELLRGDDASDFALTISRHGRPFAHGGHRVSTCCT